MNDSGDYYTTINQFRDRDPSPITPLVVCPKCKGGLREIRMTNVDGSISKRNKIVDLQCVNCRFLLSSIKEVDQSTK